MTDATETTDLQPSAKYGTPTNLALTAALVASGALNAAQYVTDIPMEAREYFDTQTVAVDKTTLDAKECQAGNYVVDPGSANEWRTSLACDGQPVRPEIVVQISENEITSCGQMVFSPETEPRLGCNIRVKHTIDVPAYVPESDNLKKPVAVAGPQEKPAGDAEAVGK